MKYGVDQKGEPTVIYDVGDMENAGRGIGMILLPFLGLIFLIFIFSLAFSIWISIDTFIYSLIEKVVPLKIWFYVSEIDHWIGTWESSPQKSIIIIAILTLLLFMFNKLWKRYVNLSYVRQIGRLWFGSNLIILFFRLPLYVVISIYVGLAGVEDFHFLVDSVDVEYVDRESGFYGNHSDATIDVHHTGLFDSKQTVKDINGTEYDDYIVVTSGTKPNSDEPGHWVNVSLDLHHKVDRIEFIGAFMKDMQINKSNPVKVEIKTDRDLEEEKIIFKKSFTSIDQVENFNLDVKDTRLVDIIISSDNEFNFGLLKMKKFMTEV